MSFFEHYNMGIPLFVPSVEFLAHLHEKYYFVSDRIGVLKVEERRISEHSKIPAHPAFNGSARVLALTPESEDTHVTLDPNNERDARSLRKWLSFADFYTMPHVVLFHSIEDLVDILDAMWKEPRHLQEISNAMRIENRARLKFILRYWRRRLLDIKEHSPHGPE